MNGAGEAVAPGKVAAGDRGVTTIADRVVAKIAEQAAREALRGGSEAGTPPRGQRDGNPRTRVSVPDRDRGTARVRVTVELGYPSDIGAQCAAVREHIASRVGELAAMEVLEVGVGVDRLHSAHLDGDRGRTR